LLKLPCIYRSALSESDRRDLVNTSRKLTNVESNGGSFSWIEVLRYPTIDELGNEESEFQLFSFPSNGLRLSEQLRYR
jgi:hypothetical protein